MERFTNKQRIQIVKTYYQNYESGTETVRRLRVIFGRNEAPNKSTVLRLIKKFETTGSESGNLTRHCRYHTRHL